MAGVRGRSGRKAKPTKVLQLHGTFRSDRRNRDEPQPEIAIPDRPEFLKGEAAREWQRLVPLLVKEKCLTEWDRAALAAYCQTWKEYRALCVRVHRVSQYTTLTSQGTEIQHPLVGAKNTAFNNLLRICGEFGLTPSSRTRLAVGPASGDVDPLQELLKRRRKLAGNKSC